MASSKFQYCSSPGPFVSTEGITHQHNRVFTGQVANLCAPKTSRNRDSDTPNDAHRDEFQQQQQSVGLSDMNLASRKANEAVGRRYQAASWLHRMVGPLDLSTEPSEEEFKLCLRNGLVLCSLINKIHPGAVPKIVENPAVSSPPLEGAPLSVYQYFENVRNFLVAVDELKLPSFEASDLDEGSLQTGLPAKVVDCILSLKAYHEWQQSGGHGFWKIVGPLKPPFPSKLSHKPGSNLLGPLALSTSKANSQAPNWWAMDGSKNYFEDFGSHLGKAGLNGMWKGHCPLEESENAWSSFDSTAAWVQHVCQKFVEVFLSRNRNSQEASAYGMQEMYMPCEVLLHMVVMVLHDKQPEEVPVVVEFMLKKVIEESEQRLLGQAGQMAFLEPHVKLKRNQSKAFEDLASSLKDCSEDKRHALQRELQRLRSMDQQCALQLESQSNELQELRCALETTRLECHDMQLGWEEEVEALSMQLQGLAQAAAEYHKVAAENRELYNQVQDLKGNIRVYCRVRPFLPGQNSTQSTVDFIGERGSVTIVNPTKQGKEQRKSFTFNKVFGTSAAQEEVFLDTQPLIRSVLDGYNVCIFAYGQTGSGKTYTMTGPNNPSPKDWGVNFRALHDLFEISQYRKDLISYEVGVQMIEVYNEQVRDLLCTDGLNKKLEIRNSSQQNGLNVPDANMVPVNSTEDVLELMSMGHRNRAVGATALNDRSSRSHSVLTVHVKGRDLASRAVLRGCLHLVDLAGSERVDKSEATGDRLKEAQHINKSLSALGDVIAALAQKNAHVPYRNSKLTQLLQESLGGQAKTLMFVHISPDADSYGETISTLKFAERVAVVELGAAHSNKESGDVRELKDQVAFLKEALAKKDGELERFQKESRSRPINESGLEKPRVKASHVNGTLHGRGNCRQPLEEMRNAEVRHVQNCVSSSDFQPVDHSMQPHSPRGHGAFYGFGPDEDSGKWRASSKLPRDTMSPPPASRHDMSKNKIRLDHCPNEDTRQQLLLLYEHRSTPPPHNKSSVHAGRNSFSAANGHGFNGTDQISIHAGPARQQNGHGSSIKHEKKLVAVNDKTSMSPLSSAAHAGSQLSPYTATTKSDSKRDFHVHHHHQRSNSLSYIRDAESGDYSTEGSTTGRRDDFDDDEEEDEGTSDYSEAERWQKDGDMSPFSSGGDAHNMLMVQGKGLRPPAESDQRLISHHHRPAGPPLKKTDISSKPGGSPGSSAHTRSSQRYSLVGSTTTTFGVEARNTRGKATLEAKFIAKEDNVIVLYGRRELEPHLPGENPMEGGDTVQDVLLCSKFSRGGNVMCMPTGSTCTCS